MQTKTCKSCHKELPLEMFHSRGTSVQNTCRECRNAQARAEYNQHGKARKTTPHQPKKENFGALAARIVALEPILRSKADRFANDKFDAEDIYQSMVETIIKRSMPTDQDAMIIQRANWTATEYIRNQNAIAYHEGTDKSIEDIKEINTVSVTASVSVEQEVVERETRARLEAIIKTLPAKNQEIVTLLYLGMSSGEIAVQLSVTKASVTKSISEIQMTLKLKGL